MGMKRASQLGSVVRRSLNWRTAIGIVAFTTIPVVAALTGFSNTLFRDDLDVYSTSMSYPVLFVAPLIAVLFSCVGFAHELERRFIVNKRVRLHINRYLIARFGAAACVGFIVFFIYAFVAFLLAFFIWPWAGNPGVDPSAYGLSVGSAVHDSFHRLSYSGLLRWGPWAYGLGYSAWLGFCGAVYASAGIVALLVVRNVYVALAVPFLVVFLQTLAAALLGVPQYGLAYSAFPFGLEGTGGWQTAGPTLVLAGLVLIAALWITRQPARLEALT